MITQDEVRELFEYKGGDLYWRTSRGNTSLGSVAGHTRKDGYITIGAMGEKFLAHRLVWVWHFGYLPENDIDHINRKCADNRIENLREVTHSCNLRNTGNHRSNTSGVKGVHWDKKWKRWVAQINAGKGVRFIAGTDSFEEAVCHRLAAEQCLGWAGCESSSPAFLYVQKHIGNKGGM